ncbi:MAG: RNA polymerase subunit sigma-70 [Ruthenibacterium sp.]
MNEIQRSQITELRKQGYGYIRIARELKLSENTVKSYCRRNGLSADNLQNKVLCQNCGKLFINRKKQKPRKFCSDICRTTWWKTHPEQVKQKAVYSFICAGCGKPFTAYGNSNRKYCCHKCYINARFGEKCGNDE